MTKARYRYVHLVNGRPCRFTAGGEMRPLDDMAHHFRGVSTWQLIKKQQASYAKNFLIAEAVPPLGYFKVRID